jgi:hypothetical protein
MAGVGCVGLGVGFTPWWHVRLAPKMLNKIKAIEYSGGTGLYLGRLA